MKKDIEQKMCSETSNLWTKLHNMPYLGSHYPMLVMYMAIMFLRDCLVFLVAMFLFGLLSTDILLLLKALF